MLQPTLSAAPWPWKGVGLHAFFFFFAFFFPKGASANIYLHLSYNHSTICPILKSRAEFQYLCLEFAFKQQS